MKPELINRLNEWSKLKPEQLALAIPSINSSTVEYSWSELASCAKSRAMDLSNAGAGIGDIVVIISPDVEEQILSFLGALYLGAVPSIFSYPSIKQNNESFWNAFSSAIRLIGESWVVCPPSMKKSVRAAGGYILDFADIKSPFIQPEAYSDPLFIQFSSGTTGSKKGVAITDSMFTAQAESNAKATGLHSNDVFVNWLPLYHDYGLVGGLLIPIYSGLPAIVLSPFDWLVKPIILFEAISNYKGTITHLPNFAYHFMAKRIKNQDLDDLNLSTLRAMVSGGEPVRPQAHSDFYSVLRDHVDSEAIFQAGYGTAECTLTVSKSKLGTLLTIDQVSLEIFLNNHIAQPTNNKNDMLEFCSCGTAIPGMDIRISGSNTDGVVGEIEVRGDCVFKNYFKQDISPLTSDGYFKTGDLGYIRKNELFVTGRKKDLIISRGVNVYPSTIEELLNSIPGVKKGRVVVFGIPLSGTEEIVAMMEESKQGEIRYKNIGQYIVSQLGISIYDVVVVEPDTLIKSTSGKISRELNKKIYLEKFA